MDGKAGGNGRDRTRGYVCILLHAHLPYVRHPEQDGLLPERWLFEANTECYIPLLQAFERLTHDRVPYRLVVSLTPTLLSMWEDDLLRDRYDRYLERMLELADREISRTRDDHRFGQLAHLYRDRLRGVRRAWEASYRRDLAGAWKRLAEAGNVELATSAATHGYLPLLGLDRSAVEAQVEFGLRQFERVIGWKPAGFWLPECGYHPGHDRVLAEKGLRWTCLEAHGLLYSAPRPRYGLHAPVMAPSGVHLFGRDPESSKQVWSSKEGYPGDPWYREYYRDIGYDLEHHYIGPYLAPDGSRTHTGFKYWRVTGPGDGWKEPYEPGRAAERADVHAGNFMWARQKQVEWLAGGMDRKPFILSPYDAELFGHWWFEGPQWLELFIRKTAYDQTDYALATPSDYLAEYPVNQPSQPSASSWGWKGYHEVWLQEPNDWIYRHLHHAAEVMESLVARFRDPGPLQRRALNQAARELLLAQSSDWPFIMQARTMDGYARYRFTHHIGWFSALAGQLREDRIDERWLKEVEATDNAFPDIDYRVFGYRAWGPWPRVMVPAAAGV